ncbi:MAG TPA: PEP-CTERM sorting domain-containing protein [Pirellulales bacterium]|nr:PEP-CTERM sorting domain-containing protein [Pirellulales bacterium]
MRKSSAIFLVGAIAAFTSPRLANAGAVNITISAPIISLTSEPYVQTGYFDVTISDTTSDTLAQFQASLELSPGASGISIVGADLGTLSNSYNTNPDGIGNAAGSSPPLLSPYVFGGNSGDVSFGGLPYFDSTDADTADLTNTGTVTLAAHTTYSLEQVYYEIPANIPIGFWPLTFDTDAPYDSISNPSGDRGADFVNLVGNADTNSYVSPGTTFDGGFEFIPTPEPASVVLLILGTLGLLGFRCLRTSRAA